MTTTMLLTGYYVHNLHSYNPGWAFMWLCRVLSCAGAGAWPFPLTSQPRVIRIISFSFHLDR